MGASELEHTPENSERSYGKWTRETQKNVESDTQLELPLTRRCLGHTRERAGAAKKPEDLLKKKKLVLQNTVCERTKEARSAKVRGHGNVILATDRSPRRDIIWKQLTALPAHPHKAPCFVIRCSATLNRDAWSRGSGKLCDCRRTRTPLRLAHSRPANHRIAPADRCRSEPQDTSTRPATDDPVYLCWTLKLCAPRTVPTHASSTRLSPTRPRHGRQCSTTARSP